MVNLVLIHTEQNYGNFSAESQSGAGALFIKQFSRALGNGCESFPVHAIYILQLVT
jgi:hypothetical protein